MPKKSTIEKAMADKKAGKSVSTQAGEFVHEEIKNIRKGKHGSRSVEQAIAIGLSEARRAGVDLKPPKGDNVSEQTMKSAKKAYEKGQNGIPISKKRSNASEKALKKESTTSVSSEALSQHAKKVAKSKSAAERSSAAKKAAATRKRNKNK